jgi:hypothetical protein
MNFQALLKAKHPPNNLILPHKLLDGQTAPRKADNDSIFSFTKSPNIF